MVCVTRQSRGVCDRTRWERVTFFFLGGGRVEQDKVRACVTRQGGGMIECDRREKGESSLTKTRKGNLD